MELTDFLHDRITEDEDWARAAQPGPWKIWSRANCRIQDARGELVVIPPGDPEYDATVDDIPNVEHITRWNPARVLAECRVKRHLIALAQVAADEEAKRAPNRISVFYAHSAGMADGLRMALHAIAAPYTDHPDYRPEWQLPGQ